MTALSFSLRVVDDHGDPVIGESVYVIRSDLLGGPSQTQYTDTDGWASFEFVYAMVASTFYGRAHVRGEEYPIEVDDEGTLSITV